MKLLISKKGKTSTVGIVLACICLACTVLLIWIDTNRSHWGDSDFDEFMNIFLPVLCGLGGLSSLVNAFRQGKTEIRVYEDHVEGVGLAKNFTEHRFFFARQTCNLQVTRSMIVVSSGAERYSVNLGAAEAQEVYNCFYSGRAAQTTYQNNYQNGYQNNQWNNTSNNGQNAAPKAESCIVFCTNCGQKTRVPKGRGHIRITCPHCHNCFDYET